MAAATSFAAGRSRRWKEAGRLAPSSWSNLPTSTGHGPGIAHPNMHRLSRFATLRSAAISSSSTELARFEPTVRTSGQPAAAPAPRPPRADRKARIDVPSAPIAEPEEDKTEGQEGRQGGNHQDRPDNPVPQGCRYVTLHGALHVAERADVEMRPQVPQAQQVERPFG